jgi:DNA polymerase-3 subunit gamma/tau
MAYTVLARRYRSTTFDEVVGQDHVAQTLKRAIESGRIAHAYLFCGTRGVGKTSMARIMAKALNCHQTDGPNVKPCGKCSSCLGVARGDDIDCIEIDAASNTQVEKTRDIIDNAQYRPALSRFKIYIIDEVHMLSKASFNALLKTLEEPPEHVKFILATTEPEKVLPTILSRCQRYDFRNIPTREIAAHLKELCKSEKINADDDALLLVARAGAGSMRDALSLLDRLLSVGEKEITIELIEQTLGMPRSQVIYNLAQSIGEANVKDVLESVDKLTSAGLSADTLVASLSEHLRNLLILRTCGPKSQLVEVPGVALSDLAKQSERFDPITLTQDIAILEELRRSLRSSQAGRALLDAAFVRLALSEQFSAVVDLINQPAEDEPVQKKKSDVEQAKDEGPPRRVNSRMKDENPQSTPPSDLHPSSFIPPPSSSDDDDLPRPGKVWDNSGPSLSELLKAQESAAAAVENEPVESEPAETSTAVLEHPNIEPAASQDLSTVWSRLLGALEARSHSLPPLLDGATLVGIEHGQATLRFAADHAPMVRMLDRNGKKEIIRDVLSEVLNESVGIRVELSTENAPARESATVVEPPRPAPARPASRPAPQYVPPPPAEPAIKITEELKQELAGDELVKAVIDKLGGEIVKVE